jgi:hypothetical protein
MTVLSSFSGFDGDVIVFGPFVVLGDDWTCCLTVLLLLLSDSCCLTLAT